MSYSRRQLYAFGEPLGNSATRHKFGGGRIYGGGGGGDIFEDIVDSVSDVVETVASPVVNVVETVAKEAVKVVDTAVNTVVKTAEAIVQDPIKALPLIAVAIAAPELAPLLEVSTPVAAAVINTGIQLANGADPVKIAENFATSIATQQLGITTGTAVTDRMLVGGVNAALNGQDVSTGVGTALGNYAVSSATNAAVGPGGSSTTANIIDKSEALPDTVTADTTTASTTPVADNTYTDQIIKAFENPDTSLNGPSPYAPTAGTTTSDIPAPLVPSGGASVEVTAPPEDFTPSGPVATPVDAFENPDSPSGFSNNAGEPVNADGTPYSPLEAVTPTEEPTAPTTEPTGALPTEEPTAPTEPTISTDTTGGLPTAPTEPTTSTDTTGGLPTNAPESTGTAPEGTGTDEGKDPYANFSGVLGTTTDENGHVKFTFDDESTLTYDPENQEVVDFTEAPNYEDTTVTDPNATKSGLSFNLGKAGTKAKDLRKTPTKNTQADTSGLTGLGASYGSNLTAATSSGNPEYSLFGEVGMASGGAVQHMASGSTPDSSVQGVYDLSTTASSPFLGSGNQSIMALKPQIIKGKINYALPGYPFGQEWKLAAEGGAIQNAPEGHNPEFFSEGGLNSLQHTYLKGGGDGTSDSIPAMLANGEFVIPADVVSSLGNGSSDSGAKVLDEFLKTIREHKRKADPKKLPPDSKGVKGYLLEAKKKVKK